MPSRINEAKEAILEKLDHNKDGKVDIQDIIAQAIMLPGIRVDRASFLRRELFKNHTEEEIEIAIAKNPAAAGIPKGEIDRIADDVIRFERNCVSGISAALGAPGAIAMLATVPVDIVQYYGYTLRATQKLLYLYGFPDLKVSGGAIELDSQTVNQIILCLGIMNGVAGANNAIKGLAKALAVGVEKKLLKAALTKGAIYPFVKQVMKWFGVTLTKSVFAGAVKKAIPVVGGVVGGGITYATFKPACYKLKDVLKDTRLSNPNHKDTKEEDEVYESIIDVDESDIEVEINNQGK